MVLGDMKTPSIREIEKAVDIEPQITEDRAKYCNKVKR